MKVLKPGALKPPKIYRGTCKKCGCEVEFDDTECSASAPYPALICPTLRCIEWIRGGEIKCPP